MWKLGVEMNGAGDKHRVRKVRSDRKRQIQPVISVEFYDCLARISFITTTPIKNVGETLCIEGLRSQKVIHQLSSYFRRDYPFHNDFGDLILYPGDSTRMPITVDRGEGETSRISIRFLQEQHDRLSQLAYSLDLTISSATTLLLERALYMDIGLEYIEKHIQSNIDNQRMEQLQEVLLYMNKYQTPDDKITIPKLVAYLAKQAYSKTKKVHQYLEEWIDQFTE
ncbi:hypothetical protein [Ammoniphilus sp. 3BR4]|uniref:hypothetical protein n=1 Tax=Ammoniphilus sp. 3BR4 TaxID=3158265 RepID=UPI003467040B